MDSLREAVIPDGVTTIAASAFQNCTNLQSVYIPASVETIGANAFSGCTNLYSVTILGNPTIGSKAFNNVPGYSG